MSERLLLVRHAVTGWNREGRFQGHLDPALSDEGMSEAGLLAERLLVDGAPPARIISSPLERAVATARRIAAGRGVPLTTDPRLMEIGQGEWEGRTHAELERDDAERYARWRASRGAIPPPGGEPLEAAAARAAAAAREAIARPGWPLCLVSHGGILRLLAGQLLGLAQDRAWALDVDNASLSVLARRDGAWTLECWNDTRHLLGRTRVHVAEQEGEPLAL